MSLSIDTKSAVKNVIKDLESQISLLSLQLSEITAVIDTKNKQRENVTYQIAELSRRIKEMKIDLGELASDRDNPNISTK